MPSRQTPKKFALFTGDGTAAGAITIASTTGWIPGMRAWVRDNNSTSLECFVVEVIDATHLRMRDVAATGKAGFTDMSAYTVAQAASVAAEQQVVRVLDPFTALERFPL